MNHNFSEFLHLAFEYARARGANSRYRLVSTPAASAATAAGVPGGVCVCCAESKAEDEAEKSAGGASGIAASSASRSRRCLVADPRRSGLGCEASGDHPIK